MAVYNSIGCNTEISAQEDYVRCLQQAEKIQTSCTFIDDDTLYQKYLLNKTGEVLVSLTAKPDPVSLISHFRLSPATVGSTGQSPSEKDEFWIVFPKQENHLIFSYTYYCDIDIACGGFRANSPHQIVVLNREARTCHVEPLHSQGN